MQFSSARWAEVRVPRNAPTDEVNNRVRCAGIAEVVAEVRTRTVGKLAGKHLVRDHPKGMDIVPRVGVAPVSLLGARV